MLEVEGLTVAYGPIQAVRGVDLAVREGEIVCLIGANGAGKTTTLRTLSGLVRQRQGRIRFLGREIQHLRPEQRVALGLVQVPEGRQVLGRMTVRENLELGAYARRDGEVARDLARVLERFPA